MTSLWIHVKVETAAHACFVDGAVRTDVRMRLTKNMRTTTKAASTITKCSRSDLWARQMALSVF